MKKVVKILILVLLPILAGLGIGSYGYNRYGDYFFSYYMEEKVNDEDVHIRYIQFLEYNSEYIEFTKDDYEVFYTETISCAYGDLFTIDIVRTNQVVKEDVTNKNGVVTGTKDVNNVTYNVLMYNVNYDVVAKMLDPTEEHKLLATEIPSFTVYINESDAEDDEHAWTYDFAAINATSVVDYNCSPKKDSKNKLINSGNPLPARHVTITSDKFDDLTDVVELEFVAESNWANADNIEETLAVVEMDNLYSKDDYNETSTAKEQLEAFASGYNQDIKKAGYFKFVFTHYIWYQALIAIGVVFTVCLVFVFVWDEDSASKEAGTKKEDKKQKHNK